ncbi:MAG: acetyl-CoA carboxylase biotin carboxyl carrier protein, partial [Anaeroplasmataceae bacterium]
RRIYMIEDIEKIIKIFEGANVSKLSLELENMKLELEKNETSEAKVIVNNEIEVPQHKEIDNIRYVTSPIVGTFYTRRGPGLEPFVTVGKKVKKGDVLCIIEAMKVMNEVTSPCDGVIKEIIASNEALVEYDEKLISIGDVND